MPERAAVGMQMSADGGDFTATWLGGRLGVCLPVTAGIVSKRLNLS